MTTTRAGIGFRVKTGYATAIVLTGTAAAPHFVRRHEVLLSDLEDDDSRQPYHAGLARGEEIGAAVVKTARRDAQRRAVAALQELLVTPQRAPLKPRSVALVVGSDVDPLTLGNLHIRAHALEGRFYREVLETAATALGIRSILLVERDAFGTASRVLSRAPAELKQTLATTGKAAGRPWRRDEQFAMLGAWVALAS